MKERIVRPGWEFNPYRRFDWDHPTQGMRFHRTLEEAFGPGARLHKEPPLVTQTRLCYAGAAILLIATLYMLFL